MRKDRIFPILLAVLVTMVVILYRAGAAGGQAVQLEPGGSSLLNTPAAGIAYQGHLSDAGKQPVSDGLYGFLFTLYENQDDAQAIWSEQHDAVPVQVGNFRVQLGSLHPLPDQALNSAQLYLQTSVRAPGETGFIKLNPPQVLQAVQASSPKAATTGMACPHDHIGETWTQSAYANGLKIRNTGGGNGLVVESNTGFWSAIEGNNSGDAAGVYGYSQSGVGVIGVSASGYGGIFESYNDSLDLQLRGDIGRINANEYGDSVLYLSSNGDTIVKLDNDGGEFQYFKIADSSNNVVFSVDESGNVYKFGTISSMINTPQDGERSLYAVESPETWIEDFGQASLQDGESQVSLDPIFAATVNLGAGYHVFLTPICEQPLVLYVASKSSTGFIVRGVNLQGEPTNCSFDYRIAAKRLGSEDLRLEMVDPAMQEVPQ
jgi:hypothetical protein